MSTRRTFLKSSAGAIAISLALAAPAFAEDTIKIGLLLPLSGGSAAIGNQTKIGAEIAAALHNSRPRADALTPRGK